MKSRERTPAEVRIVLEVLEMFGQQMQKKAMIEGTLQEVSR